MFFLKRDILIFMKKGIIMLNAFASSEGQEYQVSRFMEEFSKLGIETQSIRNIGSVYIEENGSIISNLPEADFILYLDKDIHIATLLEKYGYKLFNTARSIAVSDDKMDTYIALTKSGINMPVTVPAPLCYNLKIDDHEFISYVLGKLGLPMVVKECYGSFGKQVHLVESVEQLIDVRKSMIDRKHLYQQFIGSSYGFDTRVIVIGGKAFAWFKRFNTADFRSNIELGGSGEICELSDEYRECAEKAANMLNLQYCGIDLLRGSNGEPVLCEVNSNAFFRGIERVTGKNVAKAYCELINSKI